MPNQADKLHLQEIGLQIDAEAKERDTSLTTLVQGVDPEELKDYAINRTLLAMLELMGIDPGARDLHAMLAACWLDGFAIGHRMRGRYGD